MADKTLYIIVFFAVVVLIFLAKRLVEHSLAKRQSREDRIKKEFNKAVRKFREPLEEQKALLKTLADDTEPKIIAEQILCPAFVKLHSAKDELKSHLGWWKHNRFERQWQKYYDPEGMGEEVEPFLSYKGLPFHIDQQPYDKEFILKRIEKLLKFAKYK